jgi:hypothetical protein
MVVQLWTAVPQVQAKKRGRQKPMGERRKTESEGSPNAEHHHMDALAIWNSVDIEAGRCVSWRLGRLSLWIERYEQAWHVLSRYEDAPAHAEPAFSCDDRAGKPLSSEWKHYLVKAGNRASPVPAMMDRPLIVRPDRSLTLLPGEGALLFISIPVWFRMLVGDFAGAPEGGRALFEYPAIPMASAWFGDPISGELCYFSESRLYPEFETIPFSAYHAVCPLRVSNESDKELEFDRICIHTEFLGIYRGAERLWTNEVTVVFKGPEHPTQMQLSKEAPNISGESRLLSGPRQAHESRYFKRTFDRLKYFTGF